MSQKAIDVQGVSKRFRLYHEKANSAKERVLKFGRAKTHEDLWAVDDVSFSVTEGETVGILGHNGSGKSTLLKCVCGVLRPTSGQIVVQGKLAGLLELGAGFQPELSGRDNIYLNGAMMGLSTKEIDSVFDAIVDFSELEQFIDNQVKFYSSGMYVRLGFAVAVNVDPDILVIDEVLAVGDERFQRKCMNRIREFKEEGRTIVVVTHSADQVKSICDRAVVLSHGKLIGEGTTTDAVQVLRESLLEEGLHHDHPDLVERERVAEIHSVYVAHPGNVDGSQRPLRSGEPISVSVGFIAARPIEGLVVSIEMHAPNGTLLYKTTSQDLGYEIDADGGSGSVRFKLPFWPAGDGAMRMSVGLFDRLGGEVYDWMENAGEVQAVSDDRSSGVLWVPAELELLDGGRVRPRADAR